MAESWEITTDAGTEELVDIVQGFPGIASFWEDAEEPGIYRFRTSAGGYVTLSSDLKIDVDEIESWLDVYEFDDVGLQKRLFDFLVSRIPVRVTRFAKDSDTIIEEAQVE